MPEANHTFLPGHRIMVQVQSSWFPLYDRNPQTFVPNIAMARPADFRKATQQVWFTTEQARFVELPVVGPARWGAGGALRRPRHHLKAAIDAAHPSRCVHLTALLPADA